jgi:fructokinase
MKINNAMSQSICIFGEVLFDVFPDGHQVLGGAPFNVAWHLQAFGQNPKLISRIGKDRQGDAIRQAMTNWGMDSTELQSDKDLPTGKVAITLQDGEPGYDIVSPSAWDSIDGVALKKEACRLFYYGSLAARQEKSARTLDKIIATSPKCIFMDVNLRSPWWNKTDVVNLIRQAHWIKLNIDEFDLLFPGKDSMLQRLSNFIRNFSLQGVILTRGKSGAEVITKQDKHYSIKPQADVQVTDTVGAGDAFTSVMIMGLINGWPMQTTLSRAQAFASSVVGLRGATVADPKFYKQTMRNWN